MSFIKSVLNQWRPNPFFQLLKQAEKNNWLNFLILWNRGLGDIPLGLFALTQKLKAKIPQAKIAFLTREDLKDGFALLEDVFVYAHPFLKRDDKTAMNVLMQDLNLDPASFDCVIEKIDTTRWLSWQLGKVTPKLSWKKAFDDFSHRFALNGKKYIGVHVNSETDSFYGYRKNWPKEKFLKLFQRLYEENKKEILLFGLEKDDSFPHPYIHDFREETSLFEVLALMKNHCSHFIAPDSGLLSISFYIDESFPINMVSLWADPHQGILRQRVPSPNPLYKHYPLLAPSQDLSQLSVDRVYEALNI